MDFKNIITIIACALYDFVNFYKYFLSSKEFYLIDIRNNINYEVSR